MKYIRTKFSIIEVLEETEIVYRVKAKGNPNNIYSKSKCNTEVIKYADTIEELCDEFVCSNEHWINHKYMCPEIEDAINYKDSCEKFSKTSTDLFGAIWTDKGLIYVARMNEKGELELL